MKRNRVKSRRPYGRTVLALAVAFMMFCSVLLWDTPKALAADGTIGMNGTYDISAYGNNSTITINSHLSVTLTSASSTTYTDMQIICGEGVTLTIDKVNILNSTENACALSFSGSGNKLIIAGPPTTPTSNLQSGKNAPGIRVEAGTTLEISGTGYAIIRGGEGAAGIGGGYGSSSGTITISGGGIWVYGGNNASGIGGSAGGSAGTINISGGQVNADGVGDGAGIGGATGDGIINISGGYVSARGDTYGAGIGGANNSSGGSIAITGGVAFGNGGAEGGAGIGGGYGGDGGTILISGGNISGASGYTEVCGTGSKSGAGIGGGHSGSAGSITISGGFIYAEKGDTAPYDLGSGLDGTGGSLALSGSSVLFVEHGNCITPTTSTHTLKTTPVIPDIEAGSDKAYGFYLPAGCGTTTYVYLNESELYDLTYDANGGTGTVPETITQYKGTTIAIADGSALAKDGVAFSRWNTVSNGSGIDYIKSAPFKITEDSTLYAAYGERVDVSSVTLDSHAETMNIGDKLTLTAAVLPVGASYPDVTWSSSNTSAATVNQSGAVTAVGAGAATITATADGKSDTCAITVAPTHVTSVTLSSHAETMNFGNTLTLTATVLPVGASYPEVTWSSSNTSAVTVNQSGLVRAVGAGTATITATADGKSDTCAITVEPTHVTSVTLSSDAETMGAGDTLTLTATVLPVGASYPEVTWSSDNESVATVNQSGLVTAVGVGAATITATADGLSDTCAITVDGIPVTSVSLTPYTNLYTGDTTTLYATVLPVDAEYTSILWTSSDETVATVSQSGTVTAVGPGRATIRAEVNGISDICDVRVALPSDSAYAGGFLLFDSLSTVMDKVGTEGFGNPILDNEVNLTMPNYFTQGELRPYCNFGSTYQILDGEQVVSDNTPYKVTIESPGTHTYTVTVINQSGKTRDYHVNITRKSATGLADAYKIDGDFSYYSNQQFNSNQYDYSINIPYYSYGSILHVYPMETGTTYQIYNNGHLLKTDEYVNYKVGQNTIRVILTSTTNAQKTYTFNIYKDNLDSTLDIDNIKMTSVLSPYYYDYPGGFSQYDIEGFDKDIFDYDIALPNSVSNITLSPSPYYNHNIEVKNGEIVIPYTQSNGSYTIDLSEGLNVVSFKVTYQTYPLQVYTRTYTLNIIRAIQDNANADLCNLIMGERGTIEGFDAGTTTYNYDSPSGFILHPVVADTGATYKIYKDGILASTNEPTSEYGASIVTVVVTAADTTTTKTYTINYVKPTSSAKLSSILLSDNNGNSGYTYSVDIQNDEYTYSAITPNAVGRILMRPKMEGSNWANDTFAVYKGTKLLARGSRNGDAIIDLDVGQNTFTIVVTAADGVTKNTYTINLTRRTAPSADNANISSVNVLLYENLTTGESNEKSFSPGTEGYELDADNNFNFASYQITLENPLAVCSLYLNSELISTSNKVDTLRMPLKEGLNTVTAVVTAADGVTTKTYTIDINRTVSEMESIEVASPPDDTAYIKGQELDLTGLSVRANHVSGYYELLGPDDVTVSGYDANTLGSQTITVRYGGFASAFTVTVSLPVRVTGVNISCSNSDPFTLGSTKTLTAAVNPYNATYPDVTWTSSNEAVATVNQSGVVTAVGYGSTTIRATADGVSGSYDVQVKPQSTEAYLERCYIDMDNRFSDGIWADYNTGGVLQDLTLNFTMQNIFTQCILTPGCYGSQSTYQILYGTQVVSDNAPYTVVMNSPGTRTYTVRVAAQGGATRDYTVNIERQTVSNQAEPFQIYFQRPDDDFIFFEPNRYEYSTTAQYEVAYAEMTVWPMDTGTIYRIYNNGQLLATNRQTSVNFGVGPNKVEVVLTSATGVQKTFTYNVLRIASPSVDLGNLSMSSVLSSSYYNDDYSYEPIGGFDKDIISYDISLPNAAESVMFSPYVNSQNQYFEVKNGSATISHTEGEGYKIGLDPGLNEVTIKASHTLTTNTKTYTFNITRAAGNTANADLCNLFMGSTRLAGFDADTISYNYATTSFSSIHPVTADLGATYKIYKDGAQISADGTVWYQVTGASVVTVEVTAANGTTTKTYTINLTKPVAAPAKLSSFSVYDPNDDTGYSKVINVQEGVYSYSANTLYADDKLKLGAALAYSASPMSIPSIAIYKGTNKLAESYNMNWANATVDLDVGLNTFTIAIIENGSTTKTYTLNLTRMSAPADNNANVFDMGFYLSDGNAGEKHIDFFSTDVTDYEFDVGSNCYEAEFYVTPENSHAKCSLYLNGRLIAISNYLDLYELPLKEGLNTLEAVVTAENEVTTKTYTVSITRASSPLEGLEIVSWPKYTEYIQEQALDLTGLSLIAAHESGYYEVISASDVTVSGYDPNTTGNQTITVSYGGCSDTFMVNVAPLVHVTDVTLSSTYSVLSIGASQTLTATVSPSNAMNKQVSWSSSNTGVAIVDQYGKVTGISAGTAVITATADGISATCAISVRGTFNITAAANNATYGNVSGGGSYAIGAFVTLNAIPNPGYRFVRWALNGTTVTESTSYTIYVVRDATFTAEFTPLTPVGISCSKTDATLYGGSNGSVTIAASGGDSGTYEYSINGGVSWQGSNIFNGLPAATYTAAVRDARYPVNLVTYAVTVGQPSHVGVVPAKNVSSKPNAGTAVTMVPPAAPKGYTTVSVTYSSSNPSVATVDSGGNITFLAGGKATITTTIVSQTVDSKGRVKTKTTTIKKTVTVKQPVASVSLNMTTATMARTQKVKLAAGIAPATASSKKVKWTSSNPKVASVSGVGVVTGKAGGTAIITCTAQDGSGAAASCTVTVTPVYPAGLKISKPAVSIKTGKTTALKATVSPKNTDFKTVTWSSSNPVIATVDAKGIVRGIMPGVVTITATTSNGLSAVCTVTIM